MRDGARPPSSTRAAVDRHRGGRPARRASPSPEVSVIVPLYGRTDLVEHQIAQFWNDPDMAAAELIYVLTPRNLGNQLTHEACSAARPLRPAVQGRASEPERRLCHREQPRRHPGARAPDRARELRRDPRPARLALAHARVPRRDARRRRRRAEAALRGRVDPARGHVLPLRAPHQLWENQHYFKGFSRTLEAAPSAARCPPSRARA